MVWKLHYQCIHLLSRNIPTSDVNECATNNGHGPCDQTCINTPGLYQCFCTIGYTLANDNNSCSGECMLQINDEALIKAAVLLISKLVS